jgi:Domain of unknown function (DUF1918)
MPSVGDNVRVMPSKSDQPPRDGVVTGVSGHLLRVKWSTGQETSFIPGPGAVIVLGRKRARAAAGAKKQPRSTTRPVATNKSSKAAKRAVPKAKVTKGKVTKGNKAAKASTGSPTGRVSSAKKTARPTKTARTSKTKAAKRSR